MRRNKHRDIGGRRMIHGNSQSEADTEMIVMIVTVIVVIVKTEEINN